MILCTQVCRLFECSQGYNSSTDVADLLHDLVKIGTGATQASVAFAMLDLLKGGFTTNTPRPWFTPFTVSRLFPLTLLTEDVCGLDMMFALLQVLH
jgi:hypothetical protein